MKKSHLSFLLAAVAVLLILLSFVIPDSPIWLSIAGLVLALLSVVFSAKGWKEK